MARYKKIYPKDDEYEQLKKQDKIRSAVTYALVACWIAALIVCGVFQDNDIVLGIVALVIVLLNAAYCTFSFRVRQLGWKIRDELYDTDSVRYSLSYHVMKKHVEQRRKAAETWLWIVDIVILVLSVWYGVFKR